MKYSEIYDSVYNQGIKPDWTTEITGRQERSGCLSELIDLLAAAGELS